MARRPGSAPSVRKAWVSSAITPSLNALRTSGRLSQTSATCGEWRRISSVLMPASHAEHAEARRVRDRRVQARAQAEGEHAPRVGGVDHTVVPQSGAGVVRVRLLLELRGDRLL